MNEIKSFDEEHGDYWMDQQMLSELLTDLEGGYFNLFYAEGKKENPNKGNIEKWDMRHTEIMMISDELSVFDRTYDEVQKLHDIYLEEFKQVNKLRGF